LRNEPARSSVIISGVTESLAKAKITFDRLLVTNLIGDALDEVCRAQVTGRPELKNTRYV